MNAFPVIDIAGLTDGDASASASIAASVGRACRDIGFFAITGHGVPRATIDGAFAAGRELFDLPAAAKEALAIGRHGHNRGYVGLGVERLDAASQADRKEAFNLIWTDDGRTRPPNVWPPIAGWSDRVQAGFDALLAVGRRLHRAFALDLGLRGDFFDDLLDRPMATMRLLRYPAAAAPTATDAAPSAGTHTDYGNVTLLATDGVAGLQARTRDGRWIAVPSMPDAFVCNIGDCLMRWTNDAYVSTPHRVVAPPAERHSIAFFLDPNPDALVRAIPSCVSAERPARHPPILARDYLAQRLAATYGLDGPSPPRAAVLDD